MLPTRKTHIATTFAHKFTRDFPGSKVLWVNASTAAQFELSYRQIARLLNLPESHQTGISSAIIADSIRHHLKRSSSGYWLMILDGLSQDKAVLSLTKMVPKCHHGKVLITTRSAATANRLVQPKDENVIDIPSLTDKDAVQLLLGPRATSMSEDTGTFKHAVKLSKELGHSPVALTLAFEYINTVEKLAPSKYREMIKELAQCLPELSDISHPDGGKKKKHSSTAKREEKGVRLAWQLLYDDLRAKHPETARLLLLIGVLDVQSLRTSFLADAVHTTSIERHIRTLVKYGMVEPYVDRTSVSVTATIRLCIQQWLADQPDQMKTVQEEKALALMCAAYPDCPRPFYHRTPERESSPQTKTESLDEWEDRCEVLHPSALAVLALAWHSSGMQEAQHDRASLLFKVASYLIHIGQVQSALEYLQECLALRIQEPDTAQSIIEETKVAVEEVRNRLTSVLPPNNKTRTTRTPAAEKNFAPNADPLHASPSRPTDVSTSTTSQAHSVPAALISSQTPLNNSTQHSVIRLQEVSNTYDTSPSTCNIGPPITPQKPTNSHPSSIRRKPLPGTQSTNNPKPRIWTENNLQIYNRAIEHTRRGQHQQAEQGYMAILQAARESSNGNNNDSPVALQMLGCLALTRGSGTMLQDVLDRQRHHPELGPDHPDTLATRQNLALMRERMGDLEGAGRELGEVLWRMIVLGNNRNGSGGGGGYDGGSGGRSGVYELTPQALLALEHLARNWAARGMGASADALRRCVS